MCIRDRYAEEEVNYENLVEMSKEIEESGINERLQADDAELELTGQEIVEAVTRPEPEADDTDHDVHDGTRQI